MAEGEAGDEKPRGRRFGLTDTFYHHILTKVGMSYYMHVGVFQSSEKLSEPDIKDALITLVKSQEMLQMKFEAIPDENFSFKYVPKEDINNIDLQVKPISSLDEWKKFCENSTDVLDLEKGQLWKVYYLPVAETNVDTQLPIEFVIVFVAHHAICDAISVFDLLYRQFMPILSAVTNKKDATQVVPLIPMLEPNEVIFQGTKKDPQHLPWYIKLGLDLLRWKNRTFGGIASFPKFKYAEDKLPTIEELASNVPQGKLGASVYTLIFDNDLTSSVIKSAKSHGVTVHSVLLAVNSLALCATAEEAGIALPKKINQGWPTDLRRYADIVSPQPLSCLNGGGNTFTKRQTQMTEKDFWETCRVIYKDLKKQTTKAKATGFLAIFKYINDEFSKQPPTDFMGELNFEALSNISNIGNCDVGPVPVMSEGPVKLDMKENYFMLPGATPKEELAMFVCFHTLSTFKGKIMWNAGYNPSVMSTKFLDNYMEKFKQLLKAFTHPEGTEV